MCAASPCSIPAVPPALRGTYAGLATAPIIDFLKRLGVTTVELMPVHAFVDDRRLVEKGLRNYWGYNTIGFFAPDARYSASGKVNEFKTMVKTLHSAGLEVILDVVYNHTAEGNELGPTLCFRGIDNRSYYRLQPDDPRRYLDFTGTRQHARHAAPGSDAAAHGLAALLGQQHARRRLSLRSRVGAGTRVARGRSPRSVLRHPPPGSGAVAGEADRRAVGPRARVATRSATSRRAGPSGTTSIATRCAPTGKATAG